MKLQARLVICAIVAATIINACGKSTPADAPGLGGTAIPNATTSRSSSQLINTPRPYISPTVTNTTPRSTSKPTLTADTPLPYSDDFSDSRSGWNTWASGAGDSVTYKDGKYQITVVRPEHAIWGNGGKRFRDFVLEVEATLLDGPSDSYYGVLFRYIDSSDYYSFYISAQGRYTVDFNDWTESSAIVKGHATNRIKILCTGTTFSFYVNGVRLQDYIDDAVASGDIGLSAGKGTDNGKVQVTFDNLRVSATNSSVRPTPTYTPRPTKTPIPACLGASASIKCIMPASGAEFAVFSFDGQYMATAGDLVAQIWETSSGREIAKMTHDGPIVALTFSPDGKYLITMANRDILRIDNTVRMWEVSTGAEKWRVKHDNQFYMALGPNGRLLAIPVFNDADVYEVPDGERTRNWTRFRKSDSDTHSPTGITFSPDGQYLAMANTRGAVVWRVQDQQEIMLVELDGDGKCTDGHNIAFSPNGRYLATAIGKTVVLWEVIAGREVARMTHTAHVMDLAFSPDGKYLATAASEIDLITGAVSKTRVASVWEVPTGRQVSQMTHEDGVTRVAFSPDGRYLATASRDRTARIWEARTGREVARLNHNAEVSNVAFSPDGQYLATASDGAARIWHWQAKN